MRHLQLRWVGQLWQSELLFFWEICSKNTGLQGSTLSGPRMTTGFGPFELELEAILTCGSIHTVCKGLYVFFLLQVPFIDDVSSGSLLPMLVSCR